MDLTSINTPINVSKYEALLKLSRYDEEKTQELLHGFKTGFDIGYRGPENRCETSNNIPFFIGSATDMWNKSMKEVKLKRVAGPFKEIPFKQYIQSPVGLVPKGEDQTRLIFHLSYDFGEAEEHKSVNHHTPKDLC